MATQLGEVQPYQQVEPYSCGAAALKAVAQHWGPSYDERMLIKLIGVDPNNGSSIYQVATAANRLGFEAQPVQLDSVDELATFTARDVPVIIAIQSFNRPNQGHFVVATKVDGANVHIMDPNVKGNRRTLSRAELDRRWRFRDRAGVLVVPKKRQQSRAALGAADGGVDKGKVALMLAAGGAIVSGALAAAWQVWKSRH